MKECNILQGSTGYGRAYRNVLRGQWGVVDAEDVLSVVQVCDDVTHDT